MASHPDAPNGSNPSAVMAIDLEGWSLGFSLKPI
jgi:hypothetical protein